MKARVKIRVYGEVQGVGFRAWVLRRARRLGVKGYVKNEPDGTVLVEAEGDRGLLEKLIHECSRGPPLAIVTRVEVEWSSYKGEFEDFEIRYERFELPV
ncbi:MAG: acylphosphatase [Acidilobaceae archaeon]